MDTFVSCRSSQDGRLIQKFLSLVCGTVLLGFWATSVQAAPLKKSKIAAQAVPGELIVKLRQSATPAQAKRFLSPVLAAAGVLSVEPFVTDSRFLKLRVKENVSVDFVREKLKKSEQVEYSEPNYIYRLLESGVPNDSKFSELWGIRNTGQADSIGTVGRVGVDVNVVPVWATGITGSKKVIVAVIDTGIQWDHEDIVNNLYTNTAESGPQANNGIDDDGNGFIDDVHGWNFAAKSNLSYDDQGHGTHCAGTIGGSGNNGIGIAGVNWEVTLLPVKFLDAQGGGTLQGAVESINYARLMGANIMSNSWGGGGASQAMKEAIEKARDAGILFVAAAGNDGSDNDSRPTYPASYPVENVVAVSALNNQGGLASFSNYGKTSVHVAAPGVNILSSVKGGGYRAESGTSMACPHVSGVAALVLSANSGMTFSELKTRLIRTSAPLASVKQKVVSRGIISALNAINNVIPPNEDPDPTKWEDLSFEVESPHPYKEYSNSVVEIHQPGVKFIRVFFEQIDTEARYDVITVEDSSGDPVDTFSGKQSALYSEPVKGDQAFIRLKSDDSVNSWGFKVSKIQVIR